MQPVKLPNAASSQITVTSTATSLESLIQTAAGEDFRLKQDTNACDLQVESNTVRFMCDDNTPTASLGTLLDSSGVSIVRLRGEELEKCLLIRGGGSDATVNVRLGKTFNT